MNRDEVIKVCNDFLLKEISNTYALEAYEIKLIPQHEGGRNINYTCDKEGMSSKIIRISYSNDKTQEDYLAELEYVRYLSENGASVSNVISSVNDRLLEVFKCEDCFVYVSLFEKAEGMLFVQHNYKYREGAPLSEYFYNCGKMLGKIHELSKRYVPKHKRKNFFELFSEERIEAVVPKGMTSLKRNMNKVIKSIEAIEKTNENFGMLHFDFNDGNYFIDFNDGNITVFDFDNSCFGFYMYDIADLWKNGFGWISSQVDAKKREEFMKDYFKIAIEGYRSETKIDDEMLNKLPLFINAGIVEGIIDSFEEMIRNGEEIECDEEVEYSIKCLEDDIPYMGFFDDIFSCENPFELM